LILEGTEHAGRGPGGADMFERFTDRARRVVVLAQEEARMLNHNYIGTEHILLGLIHEGEGVAAKALESLNISLEAVRQQVEEIIGQGQAAPTGHIPFTPRAKKVLELSLRESRQLGHNDIGTEHILLGLIREGEGVGAQVLQKLGADLNRVRQQVIQLLQGYAAPQHPIEASEVSARLERLGEIEERAKAVAAEFGQPEPEPGHHWVAALRMNLEQMEEAVEEYRAKLRWAEEGLRRGSGAGPSRQQPRRKKRRGQSGEE
jgi:ATP-dependent Clp protease ATP-binding subunit ClpC